MIVRNNSNTIAYGLKLEFESSLFNYIETLNSLEPIQPHGKIILKCRVSDSFEVNNTEHIITQKYPDKIKNIVIISTYQNEERETFQSEFRFEDGKPINEFKGISIGKG